MAAAMFASFLPNVVEFEANDGSATVYQLAATAGVIAAFQSGQTEFRIASDRVIYTLNLPQMTQTRDETLKTRKLYFRYDPSVPSQQPVCRYAPAARSDALSTVGNCAIWQWTKFGKDATGNWVSLSVADVSALIPMLTNNGGVAVLNNATFDANHLLHRRHTDGFLSPLRLEAPVPDTVLYFNEAGGWKEFEDRAIVDQILNAKRSGCTTDVTIIIPQGHFSVNVAQGIQRSNTTGYTRPIIFVRAAC